MVDNQYSDSISILPEDITLERILKEHGMSNTPIRRRVLALFMNSNKALQHSDIEQHFPKIDRITLYRTLQTFVQKRLVHTIPTDRKSIQYAYGRVAPKAGRERHIHFSCEKCGDTQCMDLPLQVDISEIAKRYAVRSVEVILRGICGVCSTKEPKELD